MFFGVDNTFLTRALDADIFEPLPLPGARRRCPQSSSSTRRTASRRSTTATCASTTTRSGSPTKSVAVPTTLDDLTKPAYKGLLVVENPATSSPGLAFLLATIARYGDDGWRDYWEKLRANDVQGRRRLGAGVQRRLHAGRRRREPTRSSCRTRRARRPRCTSPTRRPTTSPIGTMLDSCFRQVEFAGVLQGTEHRPRPRKLVDFMLSEQFQADIPLQMFVFPVRDGTPLPAVFEQFAEVPPDPLTLPPAEIGADRDEWIEQWTDTVLR